MKTLAKHISCKCKCKFGSRKCNPIQRWNNDKCWEYKKYNICEEDFVWNFATCSCKNGTYLANIMHDSVITCGKIVDAEAKSYNDETRTIPTNLNEKKVTCKTQNLSY